MPQFFYRHGGPRQPLLRRIDHAADRINPFLMVIAIGLAVLDAVCLIALLDTGSLAAHRDGLAPAVSAPAAGSVPY
jgi:hypothetical protein